MPPALLNGLGNVLPWGSLYLIDVVLLADNGKWEEGAGIRGVLLWNQELRKDAWRLSRGGSEPPRRARTGCSLWGQLGSPQGMREVRVTSIQRKD